MHDDRRYFQCSQTIRTCERQLRATFCLRPGVLRAQISFAAMIASICEKSVREIRRCCDRCRRHRIKSSACVSHEKNLLLRGTIGARRDLCRFCDARVCECLISFHAATFMSATCRSRGHCRSCFCNRGTRATCFSADDCTSAFAPHKKMTQLAAKFPLFSCCNRRKEHGWAAD